ncbi:hypothetical protein Tco_0167768 [Tanacetum coccineum]
MSYAANEHISVIKEALKPLNNDEELNNELLTNEKATTRAFLRDHWKKLKGKSIKVLTQKEHKKLKGNSIKAVTQKEQKGDSTKGNKMFPNKICVKKAFTC